MTKLLGLLIVTVGIEFITRREFSMALFFISAGTLLTLLPVYIKARKTDSSKVSQK